MCRAGFMIEDLVEPLHASPTPRLVPLPHRSGFFAIFADQGSGALRSTQQATRPERSDALGLLLQQPAMLHPFRHIAPAKV